MYWWRHDAVAAEECTDNDAPVENDAIVADKHSIPDAPQTLTCGQEVRAGEKTQIS